MEISEKVAYLKGLAEGLQLDGETKEGKVLLAIIDVLDGEIEMMGDIPFVPDDTLMGIMPREEQ